MKLWRLITSNAIDSLLNNTIVPPIIIGLLPHSRQGAIDKRIQCFTLCLTIILEGCVYDATRIFHKSWFLPFRTSYAYPFDTFELLYNLGILTPLCCTRASLYPRLSHRFLNVTVVSKFQINNFLVPPEQFWDVKLKKTLVLRFWSRLFFHLDVSSYLRVDPTLCSPRHTSYSVQWCNFFLPACFLWSQLALRTRLVLVCLPLIGLCLLDFTIN